MLAGGHWRHTQVAGKNTTYSAPSLALGPSGPAIAVEGQGHDLKYYTLKSGRWHLKIVNGTGTTYSAPSLVVRQAGQATATDPAGEADIAVQNGSHSLSYYNSNPNGSGWHSGQRGESANWDYLAPSLVLGDPATELAVAFEGADHGLVLTYFDVASRFWQNDVVTVIDNAYSAPVLAVRAGHPAGEIDIADQGPSNELRYYAAPPGSNAVPSFTGLTVAGKGTTFGG